jgi:hypothetical protein
MLSVSTISPADSEHLSTGTWKRATTKVVSTSATINPGIRFVIFGSKTITIRVPPASSRAGMPTRMPSKAVVRYNSNTDGGDEMAKYGKKASKKVKKAMHERKEGTLKSGRSGKKVTSKKQAIAIGLSEARKEGGKVPPKKSSKKGSS